MSTPLQHGAEQKAKVLAHALTVRGDDDDGSPRRPVMPRGVINARRVRSLFFVVFSAGLFVTAVVWILFVWDYGSSVFATRITATYVISIISLASFTAANETFADRVSLFSSPPTGERASELPSV